MSDFFSLDIGETLIRVADIKKKGTALEATAMGLLENDPLFYRTESDQLVKKISADLIKLLDQLRIKKKDVRVVVPDTYTYNHFLEMPKLNEKELISAIRYQADQFIPMPLDEVNLDIEIIYEDAKNKKILTLLSAAPKALVEKVSQLLEYSGLLPESVEPETSAIARLMGEMMKSTTAQGKGGIIIVNVGFSSTSVYCVDSTSGFLTYAHNFPIGINIFLKEIQVNLNVDAKKSMELLTNFGLSQSASYHLETVLAPGIKDFIAEVDRSVKEVTAKNNIKPTAILLMNDILKFHSFEQLVGKYFAIPTQIFDPYPYMVKNQMSDFFKPQLAYFLASFGAALR